MSGKLTSKGIAELRQRLAEAEETLRAITSGEVDALVVNTRQGEQVFTLEGADTVYRVAIESINEGAITLSPEGTILFSNRYFAHMMQEDLNKVIGNSIFDCVAGENREKLVKLLEQEDGRDEIVLQSAKGAAIPALIAVKKLQLDVPTICAVVTDLTEEKKSEALKKSEEQFRTLSETSPVGVGVTSADGVLLYVNPSYELVLGYDPGELVGKKASDLYWNPEDRRSWLRTVKDKGVIRNFETSLKRKDGTPVWVSINASPLFYGVEQTVMSTIQDITERKKADQLKDEFIGMVSHELRTPLTVIIGAVRTAMDERVSKADRNELMEEASTNAESLAGILDNMLELSRYQAGRFALDKEAIKIADVAARAVRRVRQGHDTHDITLDIPGEIPEISFDAVKIGQVLYNLVENAVKYSPPGSHVHVFSRPDKKGLVVGISDSGVGISSEDQKKIFEPFARLKGSGAKGVGLGLVVCKHLVEAHGGRIWVESAKGKGTTFYFTLPGDPPLPTSS